MDTFAHSISAAKSLIVARSVDSLSRREASAISCALWSTRAGRAPPTAWGQKYWSCLRAAA